jgi:hypothetical protein
MCVRVCDVNKGRQRNVEKKKRRKHLNTDKFDDLFLNRALHCNRMIIHTNGGMRRADMQKKETKCTVDFMISNMKNI